MKLILLAMFAMILLTTQSAEARHYRHRHHHHRHHRHEVAQQEECGVFGCESVFESVKRFSHSGSLGSRPHAWCGWWMRKATGILDKSLNVARNWAHVGVNAGGPRVGAIVVWPHHVGRIVARSSEGEWIVQSGNDGHAVRTRPRSLARAIAFRMV